MRHTHRAANTEERRATTERRERHTGDGAQRPEEVTEDARHRPLELASCAASTCARWDRQQHRDSNMAAKAAEADHRRQREASGGSGQRDDVQRAPRAHVQEEREKGGSSSSSMGSSSTSCNNTRVHGAHKEGGETAGRERRQQGRQANAAEQWARTRPRGGDEGGSGAAAARTAGESRAATKEKPVGGSVNTGNTETELIREQRRIILRHDIRRDAGKKGARRARYGTIPPVTRGWLEARRVTGGLRWPYTWKRRAAVGAEAARRAPNAGRSEARDALRRASAQSGAYNYEERTRPQRSADAAGERGRRTASTERRPGRGAGKAPMRRMIRMGELGVRAVADIAARETET